MGKETGGGSATKSLIFNFGTGVLGTEGVFGVFISAVFDFVDFVIVI